MKRIIRFIIICVSFFISFISCTDKDDTTTIEQVEPGVYYVEMDLSPMVEFATKGIQNNSEFDSKYDPDFIYLHKIGSNENLLFPVYNNCPDTTGGTCRGFSYRMEVDENGDATITPKNADGTYGSESITLSKDEKCYFSSWPTDDWQLKNNQTSSAHWVNNPNNKYYFYYRDKDINKEIYRSSNNLTIPDLKSNVELHIKRACAGFNVFGLFYDKNSIKVNDFDGETTYVMNRDTFFNVMGTYPEEWYIKIYIGGTCYPDHFNIENESATSNHPNGYYSSGDAGKFNNNEIDNQQFLQFTGRSFSQGQIKYQSYGYYTKAATEEQPGNHLFTPVKGEIPVNVYILIKHWSKKESAPTDEWLKSDIGALQTTITNTVNPKNNDFYTIGLVMDLTQFKNAWEAAGGDEGQQAAENAASGSTSTTMTRSPSGAPVREFKLKDAKIICDVVEGI